MPRSLLGSGLENMLRMTSGELEGAQDTPDVDEVEVEGSGQIKNLSRWQFTAHQYSILEFIRELSGDKGYAIISKRKHFELCGVDIYRATSELKKLRDANVIDWNEHTNNFRIRYEVQHKWTVPIVAKFDDATMAQLMEINNISDDAT